MPISAFQEEVLRSLESIQQCEIERHYNIIHLHEHIKINLFYYYCLQIFSRSREWNITYTLHVTLLKSAGNRNARPLAYDSVSSLVGGTKGGSGVDKESEFIEDSASFVSTRITIVLTLTTLILKTRYNKNV